MRWVKFNLNKCMRTDRTETQLNYEVSTLLESWELFDSVWSGDFSSTFIRFNSCSLCNWMVIVLVGSVLCVKHIYLLQILYNWCYKFAVIVIQFKRTIYWLFTWMCGNSWRWCCWCYWCSWMLVVLLVLLEFPLPSSLPLRKLLNCARLINCQR